MGRLIGRHFGWIVISTACLAAIAGLSAPVWGQSRFIGIPAGEQAKAVTFDGKEALAGWTIAGDVTIDTTKTREGGSGSLRVSPNGKALLKLRDRDESGKVDVWVYDDCTRPEDAKARRVGPRWGLMHSDGKVLLSLIHI